MSNTKSFEIPKQLVWEAYQRVAANKGAAGVDDETINQFEQRLKNNLYRIWNRMSSGSYFPPAVKTVLIPKKQGGQRPLGIPTVSDRIAQMTVNLYLQLLIEPHFDKDFYGYRPRKSALDAVAQARQRCWRYSWVIDLDIKGFFDNINHELLMKAVRKHTDCDWVLIYVERWLQAPILQTDGTLTKRTKGTPQGGVISPLLANLFLHYAFDKWLRKNYPTVEFERYADDAVVHCKTKEQAQRLCAAIKQRLQECGLELHPEKTKIVYCGTHGQFSERSFDFLGYTFCRRLAFSKQGKGFVGFLPAMSKSAKREISKAVKQWRLHRKTHLSIQELAYDINPYLRGWMNYYGKFYRTELGKVLFNVERYLRRWALWKYRPKTGMTKPRRARKYLGQVRKHQPYLFEHWRWGLGSPIG